MASKRLWRSKAIALAIGACWASSSLAAPRLWHVAINGAEALPVVATVEDGHVRIRQSDAVALGLRCAADRLDLVDVASTLHIDDAAARIDVAVPPANFVGNRLIAGIQRDQMQSTVASGAWLTYVARAQDAGAGTALEVTADVTARLGPWVLKDTHAASSQAGEVIGRRLQTALRFDEPNGRWSAELWDAVSGSGAWGSAVRFGGFKLSRNFALDPSFVYQPTLDFHGQAALPSVLSVFQDGREVFRRQVTPGPFEVQNLAPLAADGRARLVMRDVFGNETVLTRSLFSSPLLLRDGVDAFDLQAGLLRAEQYGPAFAAGTYRRGFRAGTAEFHAEAEQGGTAHVGLMIAAPTPIGSASLSIAAGDGQLLKADADARLGDFGAQISLVAPNNYIVLGSTTKTQRSAAVSASYGKARWSATAALITSQSTVSTNLGGTYLFDGGYAVSFSVFGSRAAAHENAGVTLSVSVPLDRAHLSAYRDRSRTDFTVAGRLGADSVASVSAGTQHLEVSAQQSWRAALSEVALSHAAGRTGWRAQATGSVGVAAGHVFMSQPVTGGVAIVETGVPKLVVEANGRTSVADAEGNAVIANLPAAIGSRLSVDPRQLPFGVRQITPDGELAVAPDSVARVALEFSKPDLRVRVRVRGKAVEAGSSLMIDGHAMLVGSSGAAIPATLAGLREVRVGDCVERVTILVSRDRQTFDLCNS